MSEESAHSRLWSSTKRLSSGMAYLVWRSMRGRPQFVHIADTAVYWYANITVFFAVSFVSSWIVWPLPIALVNGISSTGVIVGCAHFLTKRYAFSRVPGASAVGAAAGYAVIERTAYLLVSSLHLHAIYFVVPFLSSVAMVIATAAIFKHFKNMPQAVQKPGYKPSDEYTSYD